MMTYYDHRLGRERLKRRYVWASMAFGAGALLGAITAHVL
jgi:hypothetical protein